MTQRLVLVSLLDRIKSVSFQVTNLQPFRVALFYLAGTLFCTSSHLRARLTIIKDCLVKRFLVVTEVAIQNIFSFFHSLLPRLLPYLPRPCLRLGTTSCLVIGQPCTGSTSYWASPISFKTSLQQSMLYLPAHRVQPVDLCHLC